MSDTTETAAAVDVDIEKFRSGEAVNRTDARGRKLEIKQLSLLEEMRLLAVAGARADNRRWMMYATWVSCVRSIDDVPSPLAATENQLNSRIAKVDAAGVAAVALLLSEGVPSPNAGEEDADAGQAPAADTMDAAKN